MCNNFSFFFGIIFFTHRSFESLFFFFLPFFFFFFFFFWSGSLFQSDISFMFYFPPQFRQIPPPSTLSPQHRGTARTHPDWFKIPLLVSVSTRSDISCSSPLRRRVSLCLPARSRKLLFKCSCQFRFHFIRTNMHHTSQPREPTWLFLWLMSQRHMTWLTCTKSN